jgi:hypothetical protein
MRKGGMMKISMHSIPEITIQQFADKYDLEMEVHERKVGWMDNDRFYAFFTGAEVKSGCILGSEFGNGSTPDMAILNYANKISLKLLVIDAYKSTRREIEVPRLRSGYAYGISGDYD